ncbi:MAG: undecaprenyldiphospho-muramoylpentapeptide beta-N-acetylglucosaminyltransferase [Calditrichia bacterium]
MNAGRLKVLFAGGGTGGHIYPALATWQAVREMTDAEVLFIGGKSGMEKDLIPSEGLPFKSITVSGFHRYLTPRNLLFPFKLLAALWQSRKVIKEFQPQVVIGTGGYVSGPVVYTAAKKGIPTLIEEQDSYPGITTRLLARHADVICLAHADAEKHLTGVKGEVLVTGNPLRLNLKFRSREEAAAEWGFDPEKPIVLVFGGSSGARALNEAFSRIAPDIIRETAAQILWQSGKNQYDLYQLKPAAKLPGVKLVPYLNDMGLAYSAADVIISRAGAITLAELALAEKPAILVPYPAAAGNHQLHNAKTAENGGAALVVPEGERFFTNLNAAIIDLLNDAEKRARMGQAWKQFQKPDAARKIAEKILELANDKIR